MLSSAEIPPVTKCSTELRVAAGDAPVQLNVTCPGCSKNDDYELYVLKTFKDRRGTNQTGIWTYWPVFNGSFSQVVPRDKEESIWKFMVYRRTVPGTVVP